MDDGSNDILDEIIDEVSLRSFGRARSECLRDGTCVMCGATADEFKDEISKNEYRMSAMCQTCQDGMWN